MSRLTSLEEQAVDMLLDGDDTNLAILRAQLPFIEVSSRAITGVGFFTNVSLPPSVSPIRGQPSFVFGDLIGKWTLANIEHQVGFLLYVTKGFLAVLEGYSYDGSWPDADKTVELAYMSGKVRNLDKVRQEITRTRSL